MISVGSYVLLLPLFLVLTHSPLAALAAEVNEGSTTSEHWQRPVAVGESVAGVMPLQCASCHPEKFKDWSGSLHAGSFSPGLITQLHPDSDPGFATSCYLCHAPASIQSEVLLSGDARSGYEKNPAFNKELQETGVSCVACHQRSGTINGPNEPVALPNENLHDTRRNPLFKDSTFCSPCHQLDNGYTLNGKPLVNTYREWQGSVYARDGVTCQGCHMPGSRHLFKGIHDPEMTRSAVTFKLTKGDGSVNLRITNSGAGHYFPTYVTPMVVVRGYLKGEDGVLLPGSEKVESILRKLPIDLSVEEYDTRIPPGESFDFNYILPEKTDTGASLFIEVTVYPDDFYNRFYLAATRNAWPNFKKEELKEALKLSEESSYILYTTEVEL